MKICSRCVLDETAEELTFDEQGVCSSCHHFDKLIRPIWDPGTPESLEKLDAQIEGIKKSEKNKEYDAIIGLSGGVDSSYLAYWAAKKANMRLLAVHVDAGWNSELAVQNIEKIVKYTGMDLHTHVVDWNAMRDVQLAFFKAGVANQDTPQDHAFFSILYRFAVKHGIKYVLNGSNYATESVLPASWGYDAMDERQIRDICRKFGAPAAKSFPFTSFFEYYIYFPYIRGMTIVSPLNAMDYRKTEAIEFLTKEIGWQYYGGKHYESRFTKFFQGYWLPQKYGFDKRKAHLSSCVLAGHMTREEALDELQKPLYDPKEAEEDLTYVAKKLGITPDAFRALMAEPNRSYKDFKHQGGYKEFLRMLYKTVRVLRGK